MDQDKMTKIVSLAKRRGFIFQGSEVYGGMRGTWDYGPLGVSLKKKITDLWWQEFVEKRDDIYGVDAAIIMNPKTWCASGHVDTFSDPLVEDLVNHQRYRTDHLLKDNGINVNGLTVVEMDQNIAEKGIKSPDGNELSKSKQFKMMFETYVGPVQSEDSKAYLRPETAQGIFTNYKNVVDCFYPDLPFGIAQIGKAFRNEISPRDFVFRSREFNQMEIEYFVNPKNWEQEFEKLRQDCWDFIKKLGLDESKVHELDVVGDDLAHYSKKTIDFEFDYPIGREEMFGLAYRTDFDLSNIARESGKKMDYLVKGTNERFVPHVIEPSFGVERLLMAVLTSAYREDEIDGNKRDYLALPEHLAPIRYAVSPLLKNKPELVEKAREVYQILQEKFGNVMWDDSGNIGKRYRKQDEIGTPYCVVIDFDTLEDNTVSIRFRDDASQKRVKISDL